MIGMWSGGQVSREVLHSKVCSYRELDASTLSSWVKFLVAIVHRVGTFLGSSICQSWLAIMLIIICTLSKLAHMNRCKFLSSSHIGLWVLKSPIQTMWIGHLGFRTWALFLMYCMTF